jgi:hypothetical protein
MITVLVAGFLLLDFVGFFDNAHSTFFSISAPGTRCVRNRLARARLAVERR